MYSIFNNVIERRSYKLNAMLERLQIAFSEGRLSLEELKELEEKARNNANIGGELDILERLALLEERVKQLESGNASSEQTVEEYKAGKWYYNGDKVLFNNIVYVCAAPVGVVCVWNPVEYPSYWVME